MSLTSETNLDESILIVTFTEPFDPVADAQKAFGDLLALVEKAKPPYFYVNDMRGVNLAFDDLVTGMTVFLQKVSLHDVHFVGIGSGEMVALGAKAVKQAQYGGHKEGFIFESREAALAWVKEQRAKAH